MEENRASEWETEGDEFLDNDDINSALECYNKALELDPVNDTVWIKKRTVFHENEMLSYAIKCFKKALEINPNSDLAKKN